MRPDFAEEFAAIAKDLHAAPTSTETAEQVVAYACEQLGADYGGITLIRRGGRLETVAPTDTLVERADALQIELGEGPCHDSAWEQETMASPDLVHDERWPQWAPKAAALGIASALGTQLTGIDGRRLGALNLFWREAHAFSRDDVAFAGIFARHAAIALHASQTEEGLQTALDARKLIGQAQGILMERYQLDQDKAFDVLRRFSQDHNLKLRDVAEHLVTRRELPTADG
ncbi:GAF and ANTAR domain-containing protein [Luteipulveratus mongoliensis]|uniref:ANTAR domain-containing protein n=1 Tax=Luteipulveratus mongoliensis TaxID=571913 RepID=A0A0K1JDG5_9MICO|nr:GAF and ANTAR domain-containing protein [Luteipulveratus mongoliensis]AKU14734.1 hypothetical protein VV02_00680 [Luteipulveratus mongoliensis]